MGRLRPERLLVGLTLLALILRLWALGSMPPGLDTDEAAIGYNAYALLRTGRDEYGQPWPLLFESFGEWKRPVYIYAAVPAVATLGLSPLAVRLPAALAGTLSVPALYAVAASESEPSATRAGVRSRPRPVIRFSNRSSRCAIARHIPRQSCQSPQAPRALRAPGPRTGSGRRSRPTR